MVRTYQLRRPFSSDFYHVNVLIADNVESYQIFCCVNVLIIDNNKSRLIFAYDNLLITYNRKLSPTPAHYTSNINLLAESGAHNRCAQHNFNQF